jgi:hypothetical protein
MKQNCILFCRISSQLVHSFLGKSCVRTHHGIVPFCYNEANQSFSLTLLWRCKTVVDGKTFEYLKTSFCLWAPAFLLSLLKRYKRFFYICTLWNVFLGHQYSLCISYWVTHLNSLCRVPGYLILLSDSTIPHMAKKYLLLQPRSRYQIVNGNPHRKTHPKSLNHVPCSTSNIYYNLVSVCLP